MSHTTEKIIKTDSLGTIYLIPKEYADVFTTLDEEAQNTEFATNEWHDAVCVLADQFGQYEIL